MIAVSRLMPLRPSEKQRKRKTKKSARREMGKFPRLPGKISQFSPPLPPPRKR
jgi:hypothetical protein